MVLDFSERVEDSIKNYHDSKEIIEMILTFDKEELNYYKGVLETAIILKNKGEKHD